MSRKFNPPSYINVPFFLYKDESLDRTALLLASFIYSHHSAGNIIECSNEYISQMLSVHIRKVQSNLEDLEKKKYILRIGYGKNRQIKWIYQPNSQIIIEEDLINHADNGVKENCTTTPTTACESRRQRHPYIKEDIKDKNNKDIRQNYSYPETLYPLPKESKKEISIAEVIKENPFNIPQEMIDDFIKVRKAQKAPVTKTAWNRLNKELSKCREKGSDPIKAFETMVASGWRSLDASWIDKKRNSNGLNHDDQSWRFPEGADLL